MRLGNTLVLVMVWAAASPSSQMSVRRQLPQLPDGDVPQPSTLPKGPPPSISLLHEGATTEGTDGEILAATSNVSLSDAGIDHVSDLSSPEPPQQPMTSSDILQVDAGGVEPDVQVPSGSPGHGLHVTSGDPGVDFLLATLGDSVNGDQRSVMALLQSLMVDGEEDTRAMDMVRKTHGGRKKVGPQGHPEGQQLQAHTGEERLGEGHSEDLDQLGEAGQESLQQQMAEFTLEPHLGPAILPFEVPDGYFVPFLPRRAFGVINGASRPAHGHGSFYIHRPPGLVDVPNSPAYGFLFSGYRRFDPEALQVPKE
ncbi:uncharacterized protein [Procambarus clarkii]|uniref:uncharacterized protein n=1 Tax=Procambarus clarkii TaxID=6728 RepID=UPI001E673549|nr:uncharacterized protein LOC123754267 [Procambarus clarkii]XP_045592461.1 uncharacterized protein LOC123754267 [Procambarus clarkii]